MLAGLIVLLLGIWGALIPFVGPYFHYGFAPDTTWHWTWERLYHNVLPGAAAVLGGVLLLASASRPAMALGGVLGLAAGTWFAVGVSLSTLWQGAGRFGIGPPLGGNTHQALEWVGFFYGVGVGIVLAVGLALGRLGAGTLGEVQAVEQPSKPASDVRSAERETSPAPEGSRRPQPVPTAGTQEAKRSPQGGGVSPGPRTGVPQEW